MAPVAPSTSIASAPARQPQRLWFRLHGGVDWLLAGPRPQPDDIQNELLQKDPLRAGTNADKTYAELAQKIADTRDKTHGGVLASFDQLNGVVDARALSALQSDFYLSNFGVRNVEDLERAMRELRRVLRSGGRLGILEITRPRGLLAPFYKLWFDGIVPLLGKLLPGGSAYTYLPASVRRFPGPEELADLMRDVGFADVRFRLLAGGIVALHTGVAE